MQAAKPYVAEQTCVSAVITRTIFGMSCITFGNVYSEVNEQQVWILKINVAHSNVHSCPSKFLTSSQAVPVSPFSFFSQKDF